jgi:hypothetical protein
MKKNSQTISFANFNLRFGDELAMLDLWNEIVSPAFTNPSPRPTSIGTFYIIDTEVIPVEDDLVLVGRLVKDTTLSREQILVDGELVPSRAVIDAAFASRFALRLSTHSLVWAPETKSPPSLSAFQATVMKSINTHWKRHMEETITRENPNANRIERSHLRAGMMKRFPPPVLDIIPYPNKQSASDFLKKVELLTEVRYRVVDPNPHYDGAGMAKSLLEMKKKLDAGNAIVRFGDPKGLDHDSAAEQIAELSGTGIITAHVKGKGHHGEDVSGDLEEMQVKVHTAPLPSENAQAAAVMNKALKDQEEYGAFKLGVITDNVRRIIANIRRTFAT